MIGRWHRHGCAAFKAGLILDGETWMDMIEPLPEKTEQMTPAVPTHPQESTPSSSVPAKPNLKKAAKTGAKKKANTLK